MLMRPSPTLDKPKRLTRAYKFQLRAMAEAKVEELLTLIDAIDGDPDFEPSLGSNISHQTLDQRYWALSGHGDLEEQCEDEGGQCEDEGIDTDSEPNADDLDTTWAVTPFALDQTGAQWAYGETKPGRDGSLTR